MSEGTTILIFFRHVRCAAYMQMVFPLCLLNLENSATFERTFLFVTVLCILETVL